MSIKVTFEGDVDRLPHKDLAEKIVHGINEAVGAACRKAGQAHTDSTGIAIRKEIRSLLGNDPYRSTGYQEASAEWGVHLPEPEKN